MKILNLYAGIGGNRKLWGDQHKVTAVENNPIIAKLYQASFPKDKMIIGDAHKYLLDHYKEFDFIWSSPPCQSHSIARKNTIPRGKIKAVYPDMSLYQEVIFLTYHVRIPWVVENVKGYYEPLLRPKEIGRHYIWSNFLISKITLKPDLIATSNIKRLEANKGFNLDLAKGLGKRKDQVLHNCVNAELGKHILNCALQQNKEIQEILIRQENVKIIKSKGRLK